MSYDYRNYQLPEFYKLIKKSDVIDEVKDIRKKLLKFNKMVDDKYYELCGFDFDGVKSGVTAAPSKLIEMMKSMSNKDYGIPDGQCVSCNAKLSVTDHLGDHNLCESCR